MKELKDSKLENKILTIIKSHSAISDVKLYDLVFNTESPYEIAQFNMCLYSLIAKKIICMNRDKYDMMNVVRLNEILH